MIKTLMRATKNSLSGFVYLFREMAFFQELCLVPALIFMFLCDITVFFKLYILISYVLVLIAEALNTAVEVVVDRISLEKHELSKKAKDIGSAAVLIALVHMFIVIIYGFLYG